MRPNYGVIHKQQGGAALIVGLLLLMLLTTVGVSGMRDTLMQERMVTSTRDRELAQQAAEAALREAEQTIQSAASWNSVTGAVSISTLAGLTRRVDSQVVSEADYWSPTSTNWSNNPQVITYGGTLTGVAAAPSYVIERLPADYSHVAGTLNANVVGGRRITDYRITARAVGMTTNAVVVLQSVYRRVDNS
jgi:type IV pilus assembly protein PilX